MIILKTNFQIDLGWIEEVSADMTVQQGVQDSKFLIAYSTIILKNKWRWVRKTINTLMKGWNKVACTLTWFFFFLLLWKYY